LTAKAVAQAIGLPSEDKNIIEGEQLVDIADVGSKQDLKDIYIYARVEPHQKSEIIQGFQTRDRTIKLS